MQTGGAAPAENSAAVTAPPAAQQKETTKASGRVCVPQADPPLFAIADFLRQHWSAVKPSDGSVAPEGTDATPRVRVVDVGAMALDEGEDVWAPLRRRGHCEHVVGFEPIEEECAKANAIHSERTGTSDCDVKFLPHALGDGSQGQFRLCSAPMTSSMLEPNIPLLQRFVQLEEVTTVVARSEVQTKRLDDLLPEIGRVDYLKLDVQGYELAVLRGAETVLQSALVIHTEVEFVEMYKDQPLFAEVDQFLRSKGFVFHRFSSIHGRPIKPMHLLANPLQPISQQLWADAVYVRDMWELQAHSRDDLLRTALIMHEVYHSYDVVRHVLAKLDSDLGQRYLDTLLQ